MFQPVILCEDMTFCMYSMVTNFKKHKGIISVISRNLGIKLMFSWWMHWCCTVLILMCLTILSFGLGIGRKLYQLCLRISLIHKLWNNDKNLNVFCKCFLLALRWFSLMDLLKQDLLAYSLPYTTQLSPCQLTWNNFKQVATRLVLIGRQLIDLTALKRNTTL